MDFKKSNINIQSATLNGKELNRTFINYDELIKGRTLHFKMVNTPNKNWNIQ